MKELLSSISSRGRITIPAEIRRMLGLEPRDKVAFVVDEAGTVGLKPSRSPTVASLRGAARSLPAPLTWPEMREVAREDRRRAKRGRAPDE